MILYFFLIHVLVIDAGVINLYYITYLLFVYTFIWLLITRDYINSGVLSRALLYIHVFCYLRVELVGGPGGSGSPPFHIHYPI
jgi:hypothetical protein